jgi:hypothetical protein
MQLPIKESVQFKTADSKANLSSTNKQVIFTSKEINALADTSNPIISQVKQKLNFRSHFFLKCLNNSAS